tara:strand:+ start:188 stop:730 length:543 start_codon:yes stop_codon:yes gene_type:complete
MSTLKVNAITNVAGNADISGVGIIKSYAIIVDQKTNETNGGTFTSGAFRTRDLNTELSDEDGIVSISSNQFTLQAGSYLIKASCPVYDVARNQAQIYNVTDSTSVAVGQSNFVGTTANESGTSLVYGRTTITAQKVFEIRHAAQTTSYDYGFGVAANSSANGHDMGTVEIFTMVEIYKEA